MNANITREVNEYLEKSNKKLSTVYENKITSCYMKKDLNGFTECFVNLKGEMEPMMKKSTFQAQFVLNSFVACMKMGDTDCLGKMKRSIDDVTNSVAARVERM